VALWIRFFQAGLINRVRIIVAGPLHGNNKGCRKTVISGGFLRVLRRFRHCDMPHIGVPRVRV